MTAALERAKVTTAHGRLAFGSVTGAYQALQSTVGNVRKLVVSNSLNSEMLLSLDGGTTDWLALQAGQSLVLDFDMTLAYNGTVSVKHNGTAPTAGNISVAIIKGQ